MRRPASPIFDAAHLRDVASRGRTGAGAFESARETPLSALRPGQRRTVARVIGELDELAREGVLPGTELTVVSRVMPGGPVVVQAGRSRLAIAADLAAHVVMHASEDTGE